MVRDSKAELLEKKGFYRRAADRWKEVMMLCGQNDAEREWIKQRRNKCQKLARRVPSPEVSYSDFRRAVVETEKKMRIADYGKKLFRGVPLPPCKIQGSG